MNVIQIGLYCSMSLFFICGCIGFITLCAARIIEAKAKYIEAQRGSDD